VWGQQIALSGTPCHGDVFHIQHQFETWPTRSRASPRATRHDAASCKRRKLPCQAIVSGEAILPFKNFTLRSKHELHAMKLYLYLAACRDNAKAYSMASYETITERIGIPERYM
jgi:hypothetical protein